MGRATVTGDAGEGLYTVDLDYGSAEIARRVARLQATAGSLATSISDLEDALDAIQSERAPQFAALNAAISALRSAPDDDEARDAVASATAELASTQGDFELAKRNLANARLQRSNILARVADLQALSTTETRQAWCADYTEDATGEVATVEINGEQPGIIIAPGAPVPAASDGIMTNRMAMSPEATYLNAALLPGWQRWSPTYRVGEITALSDDICTVQLDEAASSAQNLEINPTQTLVDVPIEYMECNGDAFELGDRVVVRFDGQSWTGPRVIGFESKPRPCTEWLWAGVNDRVTTTNYVTQINRLTAKIDPNTLETVDAWSYNMEESVGITRRLLNAPLTRAVSGRLRDPRDGTIYWTPDHTHDTTIFVSTVQMSLNRKCNRMLNALYGDGFTPSPGDGDRLYDWPAGDFIKILDDPAVLVAGQSADNGQQSAISDAGRIFMVAGYQVPNEARIAYAIYDPDGTPLFTGTLGGIDQFPPRGAAAGGGYFAAALQDGGGQALYLISETTGALVNTITSAGFAIRWQDVAIRNDKLFLLSYMGSSGSYIYSVSRYSLPGLVFEDSAVIAWGAVTDLVADLGAID